MVEKGDQGALNVGEAEVADDEDRGDSCDGEEDESAETVEEAGGDASHDIEDQDVREVDGVGPVADGAE